MKHLLGLYWKARDESLYACSVKLLNSLMLLAEAGYDGFGDYANGAKKSKLAKKISPTANYLAHLLVKGINRDEVNRYPFADLGYGISITSYGVAEFPYEISIHCGCSSIYVGNNVLLKFPDEGDLAYPYNAARSDLLFDKLIALWDPLYGLIAGGKYINRDESGGFPEREKFDRYYERRPDNLTGSA